ncbi:5-formyltetrahydrofolate cyclo-ligase [Puteibacter caeruleilacunae]|nr:5-formyltetrahydrofolate cyclo-ligase [Puteibacter caeruleilacunae]
MVIEKRELRKQMNGFKKAISAEDKIAAGESVFEQLIGLDEFKDASVVMVYWAMHDELPTQVFIEQWYRQKSIILPSIDGDDLILKTYNGKTCLVAGEKYGIPEPFDTPTVNPEEIDLILVPGVAFDENCNRMGRGRGFYDRLLSAVSCPKVGICFDGQIEKQIPVESHDIPMDYVISDRRIISSLL